MVLRVPDKPPRIDWRTERDRVDVAAVATRLLGPAPGRRGERGLWWHCPFHNDGNPSFRLYRDKQGRSWWRCYGCGEHGDIMALVMKVQGMSFPEAVAWITGTAPPTKPPTRPPERAAPSDGGSARPTPTRPPQGKPEAPGRMPDSSLRAVEGAVEPRDESEAPRRMLDMEAALALVEAAAARLWTPEGHEALAYLLCRGLSHETIRAHRLGWTDSADGMPWNPPGVTIPWFDGERLDFLKIRPPNAWRDGFPKEDRPPKYLAPRGWPQPRTLYPSPAVIRPGRPLVLTEGEFDALLLGQALGELAAVATLGSASAGPDVPIIGAMLAAPSWYIAHDADPAGDKAAAAWTAYPRARRVRPPDPFNDWTEAGTDAPGTIGTALDLRRWWSAILAGEQTPPPFTRDDLSRWRWVQP